MSSSAAYKQAGKSSTIHDTVTNTKVDHAAVMKAFKDPTQALRDRIARRIATHVRDIECPTCVDVGCAIGGDCQTLMRALSRKANVTGVDIMEAQVKVARERVPECTFVQGGAEKLPFADSSVDSIQCARLLIHVPKLQSALAEFLRVMKPGAIGVFYEGDFRTNKLLTTNAVIAKVHAAKMDLTTSGLAHPNIATDVLKYLIASPSAANVTIDGFPSVVRDPTYGLPVVKEMDAKKLTKLVEMGTLTQKEVDTYWKELDAAVQSGDWVETALLFEISFIKK